MAVKITIRRVNRRLFESAARPVNGLKRFVLSAQGGSIPESEFEVMADDLTSTARNILQWVTVPTQYGGDTELIDSDIVYAIELCEKFLHIKEDVMVRRLLEHWPEIRRSTDLRTHAITFKVEKVLDGT